MIVLTNRAMHQQHWQPPRRGIKSLNSRERIDGCRAAGGGTAELVWEAQGWESWGGGAAWQEGALAELGIINDVQQLFAASSITPYFFTRITIQPFLIPTPVPFTA